MKMKRALIQFPPTYLEELDRIAGEMMLTRPELVRIAVSHWTVCADGERSLRQRKAEVLVGTIPQE